MTRSIQTDMSVQTMQTKIRLLSHQSLHCLPICLHLFDTLLYVKTTLLQFFGQLQKWATSWQNQQNDMCAQQRLRSAWASAQSDQSLPCALSGELRTQGFFMWTAKTLIRLGGCPGWSESLLGAQSFRWFCHEAAQIICVPEFFGFLW